MANPINSGKGAELIETQTGRRCTRQNLDKLCERGALRGSPCILQAKPLRVDGDLLVSEYLAKVGAQQAEAQQPRAKREPAAPRPPQPKRSPTPPRDLNQQTYLTTTSAVPAANTKRPTCSSWIGRPRKATCCAAKMWSRPGAER
jgi:hypothetical protein